MMIESAVEILILLVVIKPLLSRQQQCKEVLTEFNGFGAPVAYNDVEPNTTNCLPKSDSGNLFCGVGSVLGDGDIGPTHSVDVSDPDQIRRFFVWHRENTSVTLQFVVPKDAFFNVSYIDVYTLSIPSANIGPPGTTYIQTGHILKAQSCSFSSSFNSLFRDTYTMSLSNMRGLFIRFSFTSDDTEWLFISEVQMCTNDPPSSISCASPTDIPNTSSASPTDFLNTSPPSSPPIPLAPTITFSSPPPTGVTVTPDLCQPDSVILTCSVASPPTDDYQYQWQWLKSRTLLPSDTRFIITHTTNTQSSSLQISGLQYSDAGEYMCRVQYAMCPEEVDCSGSTPVTGNTQLNLPVVVEGRVFTDTVSEVTLSCEIYGYPRDSSPPVWTSSVRTSDELQSGRFTTTVTNAGLLNGSSISTTERVVSQLTINNVTERDLGEYTCSVQGNSTTITPIIVGAVEPIKVQNDSALIGGVSGLAVLLLISLTINILAMIYCIYQLRVKLTLNVNVGEREEMENLYVQVEEQQQATAVVVDMKQNNTYEGAGGQISSHLSHTIGL